MIKIQAGDLRHKIALTPPGTASQDGGGWGTTTSGTPVYVWAKKKNLHGAEAVEAARITGKLTAEYTIRYLAALTNHWTLTDGGVVYKIIAPPDDVEGLHQWMVVTAEAVR